MWLNIFNVSLKRYCSSLVKLIQHSELIVKISIYLVVLEILVQQENRKMQKATEGLITNEEN